jgi:hypothetical protein
MPEIQWTRLSKGVKRHLMDRLKDRRISASDMQALQEWIIHSPQVPAGKWYKDFGTFKLCGEGDTPLTFLEKGQIPYGDEVE